MEHQELIHLAKQLQKVRNAKKPYYFYFLLQGVDQKPALFIERKPADARRKGVAAKSQACKKLVAHGRVELRSKRAVFINETALSSRKIRKAFRHQLCREKELRSASPVLKASEIISVEEDLELPAEPSPNHSPPATKWTIPTSSNASTPASNNDEDETFNGRWEKLKRLTSRRLRVLSRRAEALKPTRENPLEVIQLFQDQVRVMLDQFENGEQAHRQGHPKIAFQILVDVHNVSKDLKEQLEAFPKEVQNDSFDHEMSRVKRAHRTWTQLLDQHIDDLEIPLQPVCAPLTDVLDQLLMSTSLEEVYAHRKMAIDMVVQVQYNVSNSPLLPKLNAHPTEPLTCSDGLFPTLNRILGTLSD